MSSPEATAHSHGVDDLASLPELSENVILQEILHRYQRNIIYTYIGDIVLAVNPYKDSDNNTQEVMSRYCNVMSRNILPPHVFIVSDKAYGNLRRQHTNQCCIVSGESGSGKTESTKLLVQHIVHQCRHQSTDLLERIVKVNPLLEAFGNARTVMNLNSSRFGKLIELHFSRDAQLQGAQVTEYLLEKSRVVQQSAGERNYHIFYYLFAGLEPDKLKINLLENPEQHRITCPVDGTPVFPDSSLSLHSKNMWHQVQDAMNFVGFSSEQYDGVVAILTAVIHIADIKFVEDRDTDGVYIEHENLVEITSMLLGITKSDDLSAALIANVAKVRGEEIISLKNVYQAGNGRDALAKVLYGRLFGWIVRQINCLLRPDVQTSPAETSISILDIYGFENFQQNSFEQLCINAANEELQMFFNKHVFRSESDSYAGEGVKQSAVKFTDNDQIIKLLFDSAGIFSLIDEESIFPKSTDLTLTEKLSKNCKSSLFQKVKNQSLAFVIQHYAGPVTYNAYGFLEKNRDSLSSNLFDLIMQSQSSFVQDMFSTTVPDSTPDSTSARSRAGGRANRKSMILTQPLNFDLAQPKSKTIGAQLHSSRKNKRATTANDGLAAVPATNSRTIASYFKLSLKELIAKITLAEPHFIRCIKPNGDKQPNMFDLEIVLKQLRYTGVLETVTIRRQGFALRLSLDQFIERYKIIAFPLLSNEKVGPKTCKRILAAAGIVGHEIGKTKVFLRYYHAEQLNAAVQAVVNRVIICQSCMRGFTARLRYQRTVESAQSYRLECSSFAQNVDNCSIVTVDAQRQHIAEDRNRAAGKAKTQQEMLAAEFKKLISQPKKLPPPPLARPSVHDKNDNGLAPSECDTATEADLTAVLKSPTYPPTKPHVGNEGLISSPHNQRSVEPDNLTSPPPSHRAVGPVNLTSPPPSHRAVEPVNLTSPPPSHSSVGPVNLKEVPDKKRKKPPPPPLVRRSAQEQNGNGATPRVGGAAASLDLTAVLKSPISPPTKPHVVNTALNTLLPLHRSVGSVNLKEMLDETIGRWSEIPREYWCKVHYFERCILMCKIYFADGIWRVDNSSNPWDGKILGLSSDHINSIRNGDEMQRNILLKIGQGVQFNNDAEGNIYATKLTDCDVIVRGCQNPRNCCLSEEVLRSSGRLVTNQRTKIYDILKFLNFVTAQLWNGSIDSDFVLSMTMINVSLVVDDFDDRNTPSWLNIINFRAVEELAQRSVIGELVGKPARR